MSYATIKASVTRLPARILEGWEYKEGYWSTFNPKGAKEKAWAEEVSLETPIEVSVHDDGSVIFNDGHHRAMAGRIRNVSVPVIITKNQLPSHTWKKVLDLFEAGFEKRDFNPEGYSLKRNPDVLPTASVIKEAKARGLFADRLSGDLTEFYRQSNNPDANMNAALLKAAMAIDEALSLLEIDPNVLGDPAVLKTAYRGASRKHHPDFGGNVEIMKKVNEAYDLLSKQHKRTSPGGKSKAEEKAEYAVKVQQALKIVQESLSKSFDPDAFTEHFEKATGKLFMPTVKETITKDFDGNPHYVRTEAEWRSEDGKTVFSLFLSVNLGDVTRVRMLGGDDGDNLAFTVTVLEEILHDKRKSKFKPRDWSTSSKARTLMDPSDLFPTAKIKKMLGGKEKARKFSKRDMELGIEKLLGGRLDKQGNQMWAFIPVGEPQPQERSPGAISRADEDRFIVPMYRTVMTFRGKSYADWNGMGAQGPYVPKKGREKFSGDKGWAHAMESEELLDALVEAQKKAKGMTDGKQIAALFDDAFRAGQEAYKTNHPGE